MIKSQVHPGCTPQRIDHSARFGVQPRSVLGAVHLAPAHQQLLTAAATSMRRSPISLAFVEWHW